MTQAIMMLESGWKDICTYDLVLNEDISPTYKHVLNDDMSPIHKPPRLPGSSRTNIIAEYDNG